jgi:hypothetical protein
MAGIAARMLAFIGTVTCPETPLIDRQIEAK